MARSPVNSCIESGVYYLVKNGPGKKIVRRPLPPPTSAPLDDDFDAITQGGTTTRGPGTEWHARSDIAGSSSPLDDDFDAITHTYTAAQRAESLLDPEPSGRALSRAKSRNNEPRNFHQESRKDQDDGFGDYGEYGQYMNEMERLFGGTADLSLSVNTQGKEQDRSKSHQSGRARGTRSGQIAKRGVGEIGKPSRLGSVGREKSGPKAGQTYEVVNHRVIEDGPERTVTIATWREQVANEASSSIDVYYVGADDYAVENGNDDETRMGGLDRARRSLPPVPIQTETKPSPVSSRSRITEAARGERPLPEVWKVVEMMLLTSLKCHD